MPVPHTEVALDTNDTARAVLKRDGRIEPYDSAKLARFLEQLCYGLTPGLINPTVLADEIEQRLTYQISTGDLQRHTAETVSAYSTQHPDFALLAGRILMADIHRDVPASFSEWVSLHSSKRGGSLDPQFVSFVLQFSNELDAAIDHSRDFDLSFLTVQVLSRSYLIRDADGVLERPQYMYMRTAVTIHGEDLVNVVRTYDALSSRLYTHAPPILVNAGTTRQSLASCFLYQPRTESPEALLNSAHDIAQFWFHDGGVGVSFDSVPARKTNPPQAGVMSLMQVYEAHAAYTSQCKERRRSACTIYLPLWHADIRAFIHCRTNRAMRGSRMSHLFPALWVPNVFMERLRDGKRWTLFDPVNVPGLVETFGAEFTAMYNSYEARGKGTGDMSTAELWKSICEAQRETGTPFIMFQDHINDKNNHSHMGIVRSANLCTEVVQFSSPTNTAVCTLASISLPRFVMPNQTFDFDGLHNIVRLAVRNTDLLLDVSVYPTSSITTFVQQTRAIGVGVQGLADTFLALHLPYDSRGARDMNVAIFETIYHAALEESCHLAKHHGPCAAFANSPASRGILQLDMWGAKGTGRYEFERLRRKIMKYGLRNSMLTAQMPTTSTAHILGSSEGTDPYSSNITSHHLLSGDYTTVCPWLVRELMARGLWSDDLRSAILLNHGSVQSMTTIPPDIRSLFRTVWEIDPSVIIDMAAERGPFIDQSQATSIYVTTLTTDRLMNMQELAWKRGLKTGVYYMRTRVPPYGISYANSAPPDFPIPMLPGAAAVPNMIAPQPLVPMGIQGALGTVDPLQQDNAITIPEDDTSNDLPELEASAASDT